MTITPVATVYAEPIQFLHGDTIRFLRDLYNELRRQGFTHPKIKAMSVREALLLYFGTAEAVDASLGEGIYRAVQQSHGGHGSWRKQWKNAIEEHKDEYMAQCAALEHFQEAARRCQQLGVPNQDIRVAVQTALTPARVVPFEPQQQLPQAQ